MHVEKEPMGVFWVVALFGTFGTDEAMLIMLLEGLVWGLEEGRRRWRCWVDSRGPGIYPLYYVVWVLRSLSDLGWNTCS